MNVDTVPGRAAMPDVAVQDFRTSDVFLAYRAAFNEFMTAKHAYQDALEPVRQALEEAQAAYRAAVASSPESTNYDAARGKLTAIRRIAAAQNIPLPDPRR